MKARLISLCVLFCLASAAGAQEPQPLAQVDELKALVFVLQTRLAAAEKELGQEKARRAELELAELQRARETLDAGVKKKLGLPVPEASTRTDKAAPADRTPPKD